MKRVTALLLSGLLLMICLAGCGQPAEKTQPIHLYYATSFTSARGGDAIAPVEVSIADDASVLDSVQMLTQKLIDGEDSQTLHSPIPEGTRLLDCSVEAGIATVNFSTAYGQLSGINLTIADYCVTLTLIQLKGIYRVNVLVDGENLAYRDTQVFMGNDVLLTSMADVVQSLPVTLYFKETGTSTLRGEARYLTWYEGENRLLLLLEELANGPEESGLESVIPAGFTFTGVQTEKGVCYLSLSPQSSELMPTDYASQLVVLRAIVRSLCSVGSIQAVQLRVEGSSQMTFGLLDISHPYPADF
jgi:germination protein M